MIYRPDDEPRRYRLEPEEPTPKPASDLRRYEISKSIMTEFAKTANWYSDGFRAAHCAIEWADFLIAELDNKAAK